MTKPRLLLPALLLLLASGFAQAQSDSEKAARFYEDALRRYEKRDLPGTIIQLKNALQADKSLLPVHVLLGKALLASGEVVNAEVELSTALRMGVNRAEVAVPLAQALAIQGKQAQIFEQPHFAVAGLPPDIQQQLLLIRAAAAADTGDIASAMRSVTEARAINPAAANTWLAEVTVRIRGRQLSEAAAAAKRGLELVPNSPEALYLMGAVLHAQGQTGKALGFYEQALKVEPKYAEALLARAGILLDLRRDKEALDDLAAVKELVPFEPRVGYLRALQAERAGDIAAAKASLKEVTELLDQVPFDFIRYRPQALILNGMAHFGLSEFEKSKPYLEQALRQQQGSPIAKLLAQIALSESNSQRAIELLEPYLRQRPGDGQALMMLSAAHTQQGRHARAAQVMEQALRAKDAPEFRTTLGLSLMSSGQSALATAELEKAFKADPKQAHAGLALVNSYLEKGQINKAVAVADTMVKVRPDSLSALQVQGQTRYRARDYAGARASFEKILRLEPTLTEPKLGLARIEIATRAFDAAKARLLALIKENERSVDARFEMAVLHEAWGKDAEAQQWLEAAVDLSGPRETQAQFALVAWYQRNGQPAKALDVARQLLAKQPDDAASLMAYARAQMATKDLAGARATLASASRRTAVEAGPQVEIARVQLLAKDLAGASYSLGKALSASPNDLAALVLMAAVELEQKEPAKAERLARQIVQVHPKRGVGHLLLADIALSRGQAAPALEALRRAFEVEPSNSTLLRLFNALAAQDGGKPALELAERWLKTHPKDVIVRKALADAQAATGNFSAARRNYETLLAQTPKDAEAMNNLANVLLRQKDPGALKMAEQALALAPQSALVIDTLGWAHHVAGNHDKALQLLRDARLREPGNPDIRYHLAAVLAQAGKKAEARNELSVALNTQGRYESAQDAARLMDTLK